VLQPTRTASVILSGVVAVRPTENIRENHRIRIRGQQGSIAATGYRIIGPHQPSSQGLSGTFGKSRKLRSNTRF
jgi:hypothetical protein